MSKKKPRLSYIDERLCFALYSTSKSVIAQYQPYLTKLDMTYPQYLVYITLAEHKTLSVNEIGQILFLDSGTLTPLLKRMEANGLLVRERSVEDERRVDVLLTKKAEKFKLKIAEMQESVATCIDSSNQKRAKLRDELKAINASLRKT